MENKFKKIAKAVALGLALIFTFSCFDSDDDGDDLVSSCNISDYRAVEIGSQTWMAKNLNCNVSGSKCYDNKESNCNKYGRLYDWETAKRLCSNGWHLPSDAEWHILVNFAGGEEVAGKKLKAKSGWHSNGTGTDAYGFAALPGGWAKPDSFYVIGEYGGWWSSTSGTVYDFIGDFWEMFFADTEVNWGWGDGDEFFSVRCVQD